MHILEYYSKVGYDISINLSPIKSEAVFWTQLCRFYSLDMDDLAILLQ